MATFTNVFVSSLPGDPSTGTERRQVHGALYSRARPTPVGAPRLIASSPDVVALLGLDPAWVASPEFASVFAGNLLLPGMDPYSANYGGHQFGQWAGQLGDGRAITLGEIVTPAAGRQELQLKGAGPTPYSRSADGRAVLRSSIREFVCSEAMHYLGVPTTRALSLVATGDTVVRDMFYDGRPEAEPGAIVCRVAPSFIRFGNFELPAARGDTDLLRLLADFTIREFYPELLVDRGVPDAQAYAAFFREVCGRTALTIAHWQRVGFVHGVMNTDNMSILGLTIDYGPYGWIDNFDPDWTPNTTDAGNRRYRFGQQPAIAYWNLTRLAGALLPLIGDEAPLHAGLEHYVHAFQDHDRSFTAAKLGLAALTDDDAPLLLELRPILSEGEIDMTLFYRALAEVDPLNPDPGVFDTAFYDAAKRVAILPRLNSWLATYAGLVRRDGNDTDARRHRMNAVNPLYVFRNYLAVEAIEQATAGDDHGVLALLEVLRRPYTPQPGRERYAARRPDWARQRAGASMLSCSS
jgi:serine/tyrosine/threonine adenylyltransferase